MFHSQFNVVTLLFCVFLFFCCILFYNVLVLLLKMCCVVFDDMEINFTHLE